MAFNILNSPHIHREKCLRQSVWDVYSPALVSVQDLNQILGSFPSFSFPFCSLFCSVNHTAYISAEACDVLVQECLRPAGCTTNRNSFDHSSFWITLKYVQIAGYSFCFCFVCRASSPEGNLIYTFCHLQHYTDRH